MEQAVNSRKPLDAQIDRFKETARALECDEDEESFKRSLRKVARVKPAPVKPK